MIETFVRRPSLLFEGLHNSNFHNYYAHFNRCRGIKRQRIGGGTHPPTTTQNGSAGFSSPSFSVIFFFFRSSSYLKLKRL